ncbi:transcriptional regulator [Mycolicibacterium peregrinum]|uniref:AAA family ATPase n=1 Tax=Mycolicibacterium peregrinum TaxID=43304 RepID=UPI0006D799A1|nr:AAA family ATPase [Mycolicibacterium peregrinum]MCV7201454.1 AAA family ATPase [Mycolicibacterium peregrinum]ORW62283.1 transcriptional regulator [Mycolicibacterium peregrinum]OWL94664.1 transcriptional regulator [Mycolicibacterium peregrinum]
MSEFGHGLFIGKFYPPHRGHHAAIDIAADRCDRVSVLVMAAAPETVPLADRVAWLRETHSAQTNVTVAGIPCDAPLDVTDERVWAAQVAAMRAGLRAAGCPADVDAVFCGDDYGDELARWFGAASVRITRSPVSASAVRRDLAGRWLELAPATRAGLTTRVVVLGAESTGTTTVAAHLQQHYAARGGVWATTRNVEEYGREHTARLWERQPDRAINELVWDHADFDEIGAEQNRREEAAARDGSPILICDTDAFATAVWERRYLGTAARSGQLWTRVPRRAVYLLTDHTDVPWHDDGMREGDLNMRAAMTGWFADALTAAGHSWVLLTGSPADRVGLALRTVDPLLNLSMHFGEPLHGPGFE